MSENAPTASEVYRELLRRLREVGAESLAEAIERTVARGVVLSDQQTTLYEKSSVLRSMEDAEPLSVGIEFLVTAFEVPLMLSRVRQTTGAHTLKWMPERPEAEREEVAIEPIQQVDVGDLTKAEALLSEILRIISELQIRVPEVA